MTILDFIAKKEKKEKLTMLTCYDYWSARMLAESSVDALLVGDSAGMVVHGHPTTVMADMPMMVSHVQAVVRGAPDKLIIGDMPFLSFRKSLTENMNCVEQLMKAGSHALKLEGAIGNIELVNHIVQSGVPVMGHLGLTPQSVHQLGGFKVQGRNEKAAQSIFDQAKSLEDAGCFSIVLECVPESVAQTITKALHIPVIGIGAGSKTDGQVLVLHDLLGLTAGFKPRFVRTYLKGADLMKEAVEAFAKDVRQGQFPSEKESYE